MSVIPDNKLHIYFCDVGQGDGILIVKGNTQMVIDAGPDNSIEGCLGSHIPFWDRTIEVALMSHSDSDHSFGFGEIFSRYNVVSFIGNGPHRFINKNTKIYSAHRGERINFSGVSFDIIFPTDDANSSDTNDYCAVGVLRYGNFSGLFTGDTTPESEKLMLSKQIVPHTYLLKVPHHGANNGLTKDYLKAINPHLAIISVGLKNKYGHPNAEILNMLDENGVKTLRTDMSGEIDITTDGKRVWVK